MKQSPEEQHKRVTKLIELSEKVVKDSTILPDDEKQTYLGDYKVNREEADEALQSNNAALLKQLEEEILTPWNETSDADSQRFWKLVKKQGPDTKQENYLQKILDRGHIADSKEYDIVQDSLVIWQQEGAVTKAQAAKLSDMLAKYESKNN